MLAGQQWNQLYKIILLTLPFIADLYAETIHKTVDEHGRTSYSSLPPENKNQTSTVETSPAPTDERINAAQERHKRNVNAAEIMDKNRTQRNDRVKEENRLKQERQKQLQQKQQAEDYNDTQHYGYPYYHRRLPRNPVINQPVHRPALPAR